MAFETLAALSAAQREIARLRNELHTQRQVSADHEMAVGALMGENERLTTELSKVREYLGLPEDKGDVLTALKVLNDHVEVFRRLRDEAMTQLLRERRRTSDLEKALKAASPLEPGDRVEVRFFKNTAPGEKLEEVWLPATVVSINPRNVVNVRFESGTLMAVWDWRRA
jgi:regulator of replication initiation timing